MAGNRTTALGLRRPLQAAVPTDRLHDTIHWLFSNFYFYDCVTFISKFSIVVFLSIRLGHTAGFLYLNILVSLFHRQKQKSCHHISLILYVMCHDRQMTTKVTIQSNNRINKCVLQTNISVIWFQKIPVLEYIVF